MKASRLVVQNQLSFFCGPRESGEYDLSDACPVCGTGSKRLVPITLPTARLTDRVSITLDYEVVIPPRVAPAIRAVAPHCLREIRERKTGVATAFFELLPEISLPPWSSATTGWCRSEMDPPCPNCKRDGFYAVPKVPLRLSYDKPVSTFKVAATWEHFGKSRLPSNFKKSVFAVPLLVVDESVERVLEKERGVSFVPVRFAG